jgi:hypothetical protein
MRKIGMSGSEFGRYRNHRVSGNQEVKGRGIVHANPEIADDGRFPLDNKGLAVAFDGSANLLAQSRHGTKELGRSLGCPVRGTAALFHCANTSGAAVSNATRSRTP